jgi:hypothetical protein
MTSHELARKLLEGEDVMVTVRGYEGGVNEINTIYPVDTLYLNVNTEGYYGKHEYDTPSGDYADEYKGKETVRAIHIGYSVQVGE